MSLFSPVLTIRSTGDHYQVVDPGRGPASLKDALAAVCRDRFRRIDRYTQLALIGSGRCVGDSLPARDTGLYIGSRFASLSNTIKVHEQMVAGGSVPKPANFINTLSNSAGYYVARSLGLGGRNLFVSRQDASLIAALQLAALDLRAGAVRQALIGVVDESSMPLEEHCRRLDVPGETSLGEGSHWFTVSLDGGNETTADVQPALATLTHLATLANGEALADWVEKVGAAGTRVWWPEQDAELPAALAGLPRYRAGLACYSAAMGGAMIRYLGSNHVEPLLLLAPDGANRFHGVRLDRFR
ncbi:beta-ketoacyl synthase N-terminal-like domain-containing protein [Marinobacter changyiensis]|uniref:beta-ketoacyl synthase N-terminal-like domain-containing protein n=1 Tax=Marinobacter changyiensis TaxID=2604091 RepID=UPI0012659A52|nr:beta-ketoacyl synthase N-terminal-like domain-containing protein [Marinobacter changyiensis]